MKSELVTQSREALKVRGENLNDVLSTIYRSVLTGGIERSPRGQRVREWPSPVFIELDKHDMPWSFIQGRKFNPFFAVAEVIWILAGRNDVEFISYYNSKIKDFSDDGITFHGAYGYRFRAYPTLLSLDGELYADYIDQIALVIHRLKKDPQTRQAVLGLWNPSLDLKDGSKDYPCNNLCYFSQRDGALDMSVVRRSNDMVWGLPYNQVQFYFLHAMIAGALGVQMGRYHEFVQNMHVYLDNYKETLGRIENVLSAGHEIQVSGSAIYESAQIDRRISEIGFLRFQDIFFAQERIWRKNPELMNLKSYREFEERLLGFGVPEYWVYNIAALPMAYIARKSGLSDLEGEIYKGLEKGLRWLVDDFISSGSVKNS